MDRFAALEAFVRVAETQSFSEAARRLRISKSAVSRSVGALETELGARLFNRTTRSLNLTEAGRGYLERVTRILADLEDADRALGRLQARPRGRLQVSAPMSFGFLHLAPALPEFLARFPEVDVEMALSDRFVDLVDDGFDVALRIGALPDSSLVARRIAPIRLTLCASPDYFGRRGTPQAPDELKAHECLRNRTVARVEEWRFVDPDGKPRLVPVSGRVGANNGDALRAMALAGVGVALLPTFIVGPDLSAGALVPALDRFLAQDLAMSAVYPHSRHLSPKVRAFVDFLVERFGRRPYWDPVDRVDETA
ncbi:DNA-binding transcriptional LysR family regulator [Roseiarcus fermentans]|uniref:DNA-binding transcriptional LysR family regulator n=1 Tax=Roseiarcus fermentans TaxID=1473586 RepID=A0A366EY57_9HYPH|nr:LysR family transcriptional regulator [Roseiarcus fermentans]RBP07284.1 DNA-binding transcriptional LysR family regulator [Roseiarcus fermentans]